MIDGKTIADMEFLMETWNMNNGTDGFIDFYANHHPNCRHDEEQVEDLLNLGKICTQMQIMKILNLILKN